MPRMTPLDGPVSFDSKFRVNVKTNASGAELVFADVAFDQMVEDRLFTPVRSFGPNADEDVLLDTPKPGHLYRFRLFGPSANDNLIEEINIPRLESGLRKDHLTACSGEAKIPQLAVETGGTFVTAVIGSGRTKCRALLLVSDANLAWQDGEFPQFVPYLPDEVKFLLSSASNATGLINDVAVWDQRSDGWPDSARLGPGVTVRFVAVVWDSDGGFDFTWTTTKGLPNDSTLPMEPPEDVSAKKRIVDLVVTALVCLDDSDDLSDGEADFKITLTSGSRDTRDVSWKPMETGSTLSLNEQFQATDLMEGDVVTIAVSGTEDDSDSFPSDDDDTASAASTLQFRRGPGTETFSDILTLDSQAGGDGFRYLMHCSFDVSYA